MRTFWLRSGAIVLVSLLIPTSGQSFTISGSSPATGQLGMNLTTQQAVELSITGAASGSGETTTLTEPGAGGRQGDVNFGSVNTLNSTPLTGKRVRLASNNGARFVATLSALPTASGFPNGADIEICRSDTLTSVPSGRLRWATGNTTDWSVATPGTVMSENCVAKNMLADNRASGSAVLHEFALEILDTDAAGAKTVEITYTITGAP